MSSRFLLHPTPLAGAVVLERQPIGDARGFLERLWCDAELASLLPGKAIRQINRTLTSKAGTIRGLHFQRGGAAETKLVHCLRGRVLDVAVDLRGQSPTFGQWHAVELAGNEHRTFLIPEGFAHGFQALTDDCEMLYFHTAPHDAAAEGGINPLDPRLAIAWPLPVGEMSARDAGHPPFDETFEAL